MLQAIHSDSPIWALHAVLQAASLDSTAEQEPQRAAEAWKDSNWINAMLDEHGSIVDNKTYHLVKKTDIPHGLKPLRCKWVYKLKRNEAGRTIRHKARLVVRGFEQREGIDYQETFASVVKPMSYKALLAIAAAQDLEVHQMDVKTAFLYGKIDQPVYIIPPEGIHCPAGHIWQLDKALYGLKQAPRIWFNTLTGYLDTLGFTPLSADPGLFYRELDGLIIAVYVDDLLIVGKDKDAVDRLKGQLAKQFKMEDLGPCHWYLGIQIKRDRQRRILQLSQKTYIERTLQDLGMEHCNPVSTPINERLTATPEGFRSTETDRHWYARAIGALMYIMLGTRPDIAYAISVCSRYMGNPTAAHIKAAKRILRYLKGTSGWALEYTGNLTEVQGYSDADWGGDLDGRRSTGGYIFNLGSGAISWRSKRQQAVALSTCEAEYMAQTQATKEAIWLRNLMQGFQGKQLATTVLYGDNQGAIAMTKNPQFHGRTKHIDIQHHYVRERVATGEVEWKHVPTAQQVADGLTKPLERRKFEAFRQALGLTDETL
jgi:hypothetical protein